jgi:uncharacterized protein (TIGR03000 family)
MIHRVITLGTLLLLAGAAVFMTASPVQAQRGGGHGSGFHAGGHGGSHIGGYHGGYNYSGYGRGYGYRPYYGYRHYYGGYYPDYAYFSYYPYHNDSYLWGGSSFDNTYADDATRLYYGVTTDSGYRGLSPQEYEAYARAATATNGSVATPVDTAAYVTASVPANAEIWIDGMKTTSTGRIREFQSPPLAPGQRYSYEVQARWNENGREVTQTQKVPITAGARVIVGFPVSPATAKTQAAGG